jgi:SAM-dependent methyltransferase
MMGERLEEGSGRTGDGASRRFGEVLDSRIRSLVDAWRSDSGRKGPAGRLLASEAASVGKALLGLQRGLTGDRHLAGKGYMDDPDLLGAYLLYYWPVSYLQVGLALETLTPKLPAGARILDLGSGPGPASAALGDWLAARTSSGSTGAHFLLADSSRPALDLARSLLGTSGDRAVESKVLDLEAPAALDAVSRSGPFDLVVMGHCLNELWPSSAEAPEKRLELAEGVMDLLAPGGLFLIVEPSLLRTSRDLLSLRDALAARGHRVLGPCLRQGPCPALAAGPSHTCHSEVAWDPSEPVASLAAAAGLDRQSVKMTWLAIAPAQEPAVGPELADREPAAARPETLASGKPASKQIAPPAAARRLAPEEETALVVSEPMLNKAGRLRYLLCNDAGRFAVSARKDDPAARAAGFFSLKRGDKIRLRGTEVRGTAEAEALGFLPGTELEIVVPAPSIAAAAESAPIPPRPPAGASGERRHG